MMNLPKGTEELCQLCLLNGENVFATKVTYYGLPMCEQCAVQESISRGNNYDNRYRRS